MTKRSLAYALLLLGTASGAPAGAHDSSLSCVDGSTGFNLTVNSFEVGATASVSATGSGAGAGKVVYKPLDVHTSLGNFDAAFKSLQLGHAYPSCTLTTQAVYGETITFLFKSVIISSVDMIVEPGRSENARGSFTDVMFAYQAVQFTQVPGSDTPN